MGKKKSQNNFKTKTYRKEERRKKKLLKSQRRADKRQKQKIERGLTDICSNLVKLGIEQGIKSFVKSDQNQTKELDNSWINYKNSMDNLSANENMPLNSTSQFLLDNGLSLSDVTLQSKINNRKKERKSRKKTRKNFSMVKLLSSLPEVDEDKDEDSEETTETSLPVTITKPSSFQYDQRDAKKFHKNILRKERSSSRKLKIKLD